MSENTTPELEVIKPASISEALGLIDQPDAIKDMFGEKLLAADKVTRENNSRILSIREAKDADPNNTEYQDLVWHRVIAEKVDDKEMIAAERKYQAAQAESEKQLEILRAGAKARHIRPAMTDEEVQAAKKLVNEGKAVVTEARATATAFAEMADKFLAMTGKKVEGGIIALLPPVESMLNTRGRKAGTKSGDKPYSTRLVLAEIDGKSTNKDRKDKTTGEIIKGGFAHFDHVAEELSKRFGANTFPQNGVTGIDVEKAYYDSKNATWRESAEMPEDHSFKFTKEITVQNPNDDSTKVEPHTVNLHIVRWTKETAGIADETPAKAEDAKPEKPAAKK